MTDNERRRGLRATGSRGGAEDGERVTGAELRDPQGNAQSERLVRLLFVLTSDGNAER